MLLAGIIAAVLVIALIFFEFNIRKPGQIVVHEVKGEVRIRKNNFYPKHFSMPISVTTHSVFSNFESEAKGKIPLLVKISSTITPSSDNIAQLIKVGGWEKDLLLVAAKEFETIIQGLVKNFTSRYEVEMISSENLQNHIKESYKIISNNLGIEILSLTIQSLEPIDKKISDAIKQKEEARILEETEKLNQNSRTQAARIKFSADEEIMKLEHEMALKKIGLREVEFEKETKIDNKRLEEELKRNKMRLETEKDEVALLKNNPELLLLSPQVARLAESSQNLRNAKTIISFGDIDKGSELVEIFKNFIQNIAGSAQKLKD